jgi:hypothetical protein
MRKVFHFDAPREKYQCDAAVVWCFDNRFETGLRKYLKRTGIVNIDPIKVAGGAKSLATPEHPADRVFLLEQLAKSVRLHGTGRVVLMLHSDCGAYGGLEGAFRGDRRWEAEQMERDLRLAAETVLARFPNVTVETYFVDFDGVWEVERPMTVSSNA